MDTSRPGEPIGQRIREARRARGLTQVQLAAETGLEQATISKYECGDIDEPSAPKIAVLARALAVSMEWITTGDGDGPAPADAASNAA